MFLPARPSLQALRLAWASAPVWTQPAIAEGLRGPSDPVRAVALVGLWAAWTITLVALLVPSTVALTVVRTAGVAVVLGASWAALAGHDAWWTLVVVAGAVVLGAALLGAPLGEAFVQGSAYGDEQRFPLKPPAAAMVVSMPVAWALAVVGVAAGPALLAAGQVVAGVAALAVGFPLARLALLGLHRLTRRFLVLVPAGLVLHDHMVLTDSALFRRPAIAAVGLAGVGSEALDLTGGAAGMAVEVDLTEDAAFTIAPVRRGGAAEPVTTRAVLISPSRPGRVLAECGRRRLPVR